MLFVLLMRQVQKMQPLVRLPCFRQMNNSMSEKLVVAEGGLREPLMSVGYTPENPVFKQRDVWWLGFSFTKRIREFT